MVKGKTRAMVNEDVHDVKKNDLGYIDAYVSALARGGGGEAGGFRLISPCLTT